MKAKRANTTRVEAVQSEITKIKNRIKRNGMTAELESELDRLAELQIELLDQEEEIAIDNIQEEEIKAGEKLKAFNHINTDLYEVRTLENLYYAIEHEVNLYNEGEDCNTLSKAEANAAKKWLCKMSDKYNF